MSLEQILEFNHQVWMLLTHLLEKAGEFLRSKGKRLFKEALKEGIRTALMSRTAADHGVAPTECLRSTLARKALAKASLRLTVRSEEESTLAIS